MGSENLEKNEALYQKIKAELIQIISELPENSKIPTRSELSQRFNVARTTLDRAISELVGEGYLTSKVGSGTYVRKQERPGISQNSQNRMDNIWGFLLPTVTEHSFPEMIRGAEDVCSKNGISLILCNTDKSSEKQDKYIDNLVAIGAGGIIAVPSAADDTLSAQKRFADLLDKGIKIVFCTGGNQAIKIPKVVTNDFSGAALMVGNIVDMGWKRPAFVSRIYIQPTEQRYAGYIHALNIYGISLDYDLVCLECSEEGEDTLYNRIDKMLSLPAPPDSFVCFNDEVAMEVYRVCKDRQLQVGKDIGVIGFDSTPICEEVSPKLSSIRQPFYDIGKTAASVLLEMIKTDSFPRDRITILEPLLDARESLG